MSPGSYTPSLYPPRGATSVTPTSEQSSDVFFVDGNRIIRYDHSQKRVSLVASTLGLQYYHGDGEAAKDAALHTPTELIAPQILSLRSCPCPHNKHLKVSGPRTGSQFM